MLSDMMLAMGWGLIFGTLITLFLMPIIYSFLRSGRRALEEVL
jgi:multidrug efflux pump subunit AcrB